MVGGTQLGWKSANLVRENKNGVLASYMMYAQPIPT